MPQIDKNTAIEVHDLTVSYNNKPVLWDIDLLLPQGKIIGIIGPNGAGKSTLLKSIMGLIPINSGYIKIFDNPLNIVRNSISYVPQKDSVDWDFPASVLDVVVMGRYNKLKLFQRIRKEDREKAMECLHKVDMLDYANNQISELSGGQQQRILLARSLAQDADLYLMDEPFVGIDAATEKLIITLLKNMAAEGKTLLIVHHDLHSAIEYFDWCVLLNMHLIASGPTEETLIASLLEKTYRSKLTILTKVGNIIKHENLTPRENFKL